MCGILDITIEMKGRINVRMGGLEDILSIVLSATFKRLLHVGCIFFDCIIVMDDGFLFCQQ